MSRSLSLLVVLVAVAATAPLYAATYDSNWGVSGFSGFTSTAPFRTRNNLPFFGANTTNLAGISLKYNSTPVGGTLWGLGWDTINVSAAVPSAGPIALAANAPGVTLNVALPFSSDNSLRTQSAGLVGTDASVANTVANEFLYVTNGGNHPSATFTFNNLGANRNVFVQMIGGDADNGWAGDFGVTANGNSIGTWTTPANGFNGTTASLFGFNTTTNASGQLQLVVAGNANNFAGLAGIAILGQTSPTVAPVESFDADITSTASLRTATNSAPFASSTNLAGVNLNYGTTASGTVNGVGFDNVNISGIDFSAGPITLSANASGVTLELQVTRGSDSPGGRAQGQALTGPDAATLNQVYNDIRYTDHSSTISDHITSLYFHGLGGDRDVYVELLGSTNGWNGAPEVFANGDLVGIWDSNPGTQAALYGFYARTDLLGNLMIDVASTNTSSPFSGLSGVVIIGANAVPEPASLILWTCIGMVGCIGAWRCRRSTLPLTRS